MINNSFKNIAITGASGAIGKSFVKILSEINSVETINVFSRSNEIFNSEKVFNHVVKYENENDLIEAAKIASFKNTLDLVIVANGILHNENIYPEKKISDLTEEKFKELFFVNTILPSIIAKHFIPKMSQSNKSIFAFMSARVGSISDNKLGGWYAYRSSKAALNMMIKNLSIEVGRKNKNAILVGLHPGTVNSNLSKPFQSNVPEKKLFSPDQSVNYLLKVLFNLRSEDTGKIFAWDGTEIQP